MGTMVDDFTNTSHVVEPLSQHELRAEEIIRHSKIFSFVHGGLGLYQQVE